MNMNYFYLCARVFSWVLLFLVRCASFVLPVPYLATYPLVDWSELR